MQSMRPALSLMILTALGVWVCHSAIAHAGADAGRVADLVKVLATPDGGIQPQAAVDDRGIIHLVYFEGEPAGGDLFYARLAPGAAEFSRPVRVSSQPGSAIAIGTIRGGAIGVGMLVSVENQAERTGSTQRSIGRQARSLEKDRPLFSPRESRPPWGDIVP